MKVAGLLSNKSLPRENEFDDSIIENVISQNCWGETFNTVAPEHPTRAEYYHKKALEMNLKVPTFVKDSKSKGKIISSKKLQKILNYTFQKQI
mgnify:CR=1 FL=1